MKTAGNCGKNMNYPGRTYHDGGGTILGWQENHTMMAGEP
jgi:hypothetical protein